jgi:N-acyl homoserine lactone hydrolase
MNPATAALGASLVCPGPGLVEGVRVEVLNTGWVTADWRLVLDTGQSGAVKLPVLIGHIRHPDGDVYVDAGLGQTSRDGRYPRFPMISANIEVPPGLALVEQAQAPPATVLLTHLHYDHIGGLLDLDAQTEAWTTLEEWRTARTSNIAFPEARMNAAVKWRIVDLRAGNADQILGVPAHDVKGDGSIWYLSTPGHTPGAAAVLVLAEDAPWLFIGDTAWVDDHLGTGMRPRGVSIVVDGRPKEHKESLKWARLYKKKCPGLNVVAGHEPRWAENIQ